MALYLASFGCVLCPSRSGHPEVVLARFVEDTDELVVARFGAHYPGTFSVHASPELHGSDRELSHKICGFWEPAMRIALHQTAELTSNFCTNIADECQTER